MTLSSSSSCGQRKKKKRKEKRRVKREETRFAVVCWVRGGEGGYVDKEKERRKTHRKREGGLVRTI